MKRNVLLASSIDVARLLDLEECMDAVAEVFSAYALGSVSRPGVLGIHSGDGGFHIKAGKYRKYFVTKINSNFPLNPKINQLPTIQGAIALFDSTNGRLLALLDSAELTIIRTGAATGLAAKYLSLPEATVATICGCGNQGRISLKALLCVRKLSRVNLFDTDPAQLARMTNEFESEVEIVALERNELHRALQESEIVITCTTSTTPFIHPGDISKGCFIAAVGADNENKQELFPELVAQNKVVVDIADQCAAIGEFHHALESGSIGMEGIHAELGEIISGTKPGRQSKEEIIIFDSTGTALQDVAATAIVYEKAISSGSGATFNFSDHSLIHI